MGTHRISTALAGCWGLVRLNGNGLIGSSARIERRPENGYTECDDWRLSARQEDRLQQYRRPNPCSKGPFRPGAFFCFLPFSSYSRPFYCLISFELPALRTSPDRD